MAFDWTKIEGYRDGMTDAEKIALLEKIGMPNPTSDMIAKSQFDKVSSELAAAKKQLKERMTEEERKDAEQQAAFAAMKEEVESLRKERAFERHKASFLAQKYDAADAEAMAEALISGDSDGLFKALSKANETAEKNLRAELMKSVSEPPTGGNDHSAGKDDAIKLAEQLAAQDVASSKAASYGLSHYM